MRRQAWRPQNIEWLPQFERLFAWLAHDPTTQEKAWRSLLNLRLCIPVTLHWFNCWSWCLQSVNVVFDWTIFGFWTGKSEVQMSSLFCWYRWGVKHTNLICNEYLAESLVLLQSDCAASGILTTACLCSWQMPLTKSWHLFLQIPMKLLHKRM